MMKDSTVRLIFWPLSDNIINRLLVDNNHPILKPIQKSVVRNKTIPGWVDNPRMRTPVVIRPGLRNGCPGGPTIALPFDGNINKRGNPGLGAGGPNPPRFQPMLLNKLYGDFAYSSNAKPSAVRSNVVKRVFIKAQP